MTRLAFVNGIALAFQTIRSHKLRAFLTVLGVIIGTGTIIGVSAILAGAGGLAGVAIAWVVAIIVRSFTSVPMALPWTSVAIGVGLSATVGLFFGIYPARRASKLDPIEALRVER